MKKFNFPDIEFDDSFTAKEAKMVNLEDSVQTDSDEENLSQDNNILDESIVYKMEDKSLKVPYIFPIYIKIKIHTSIYKRQKILTVIQN